MAFVPGLELKYAINTLCEAWDILQHIEEHSPDAKVKEVANATGYGVDALLMHLEENCENEE